MTDLEDVGVHTNQSPKVGDKVIAIVNYKSTKYNRDYEAIIIGKVVNFPQCPKLYLIEVEDHFTKKGDWDYDAKHKAADAAHVFPYNPELWQQLKPLREAINEQNSEIAKLEQLRMANWNKLGEILVERSK